MEIITKSNDPMNEKELNEIIPIGRFPASISTF